MNECHKLLAGKSKRCEFKLWTGTAASHTVGLHLLFLWYTSAFHFNGNPNSWKSTGNFHFKYELYKEKSSSGSFFHHEYDHPERLSTTYLKLKCVMS